MAHIMAGAVQKLWPHAKFGVGPVIEDGLYYDFDLGDSTLSETDFPKIEAEMLKIIKADYPFKQFNLSIAEAIDWAKQNKQPYKLELLNDLRQFGTTSLKDMNHSELGLPSDKEAKVTDVSFYSSGDFTDLCQGPHVKSTGEVGVFKLARVSGAYWRGKSDNQQMQRIYAVAFKTKDELEDYLEREALAKQNDHRIIGEKLQLFLITEEVGAGLPLLTPRGEQIKYQLMEYMRRKEEARGYQFVSTPVLTHTKLYELSGHANFYKENMYITEPDEEGNQFYVKPMNCPHHHMIFRKLVNSYRDLPLRLCEYAGLYRHELSGTLTGLIRVRGPITQNDSHTYVTPDQAESEFVDLIRFFDEVYADLGVKDYWFRLSLPDFDKDKYAGDKSKWLEAAKFIRNALKKTNSKFVEEIDEAAFYGPKVDVQLRNVNGKEDSVATIQLDILVPERMNITYVDSSGNKQYPLVIHKSIMGSFERFMAFLLEQTGGDLPIWLCPEQVRLISLNQEADTLEFVHKLAKLGRSHGVRVGLDNSNESVGKKIRAAELMKIPFTIVIGGQELKSDKLLPRVRHDLKLNAESFGSDDFFKKVAELAKVQSTL